MDLNATRALVAGGAVGDLPELLPLDGIEALPMALSLEGREVVVGRAGAALARRMPHLVCLEFLPHLGRPRRWSAGRHRLDARAATALVLHRLWREFGGVDGLALTVPRYLAHDQIALLAELCQHAGLPLVGLVPGTLATALAAYQSQPWHGLALVLDVDDHALMWTAVMADHGQAWVVESDAAPHLGLRAWKERILNAAAERCVRQSRRDPRDSAAAEQSLFEQLDSVMEACRAGRLADLAIETDRWYQNLVFRPDELAAVRSARASGNGADASPGVSGHFRGLSVVLVTGSAGRLPGMPAALAACVNPARARPG
jgi:molecular chaperone DnaK (HSP70)